jgi:hypothetical protein
MGRDTIIRSDEPENNATLLKLKSQVKLGQNIAYRTVRSMRLQFFIYRPSGRRGGVLTASVKGARPLDSFWELLV